MTSKYTAPNNISFANLYMPYKSGSKQLVNYQENGVDIGTIYQGYYRGSTSSVSNFKSLKNGISVDISLLFQNINVPLVFGTYVSNSKFSNEYRILTSSVFTFNITLENVIKYEVNLNKRDSNDNIITTNLLSILTMNTNTTSSFTIPVTASLTKESYQPQITLYNDVGNTYSFICDKVTTVENCRHIRITACGGGGGGGSGGRNTFSNEPSGGQGGGGGASSFSEFDIYLPMSFNMDSITIVGGIGGEGSKYANNGSTDGGVTGLDGNDAYIKIGPNNGFFALGGKGGRGGAQNHREPDTGFGTGGKSSLRTVTTQIDYEHAVIPISSYTSDEKGFYGIGNQEWDKLYVIINGVKTFIYTGYPAGNGGANYFNANGLNRLLVGATYFINPDGPNPLPAELNGSGGSGGFGSSDIGTFPKPGKKGNDGFMKIEYKNTYFV